MCPISSLSHNLTNSQTSLWCYPEEVIKKDFPFYHACAYLLCLFHQDPRNKKVTNKLKRSNMVIGSNNYLPYMHPHTWGQAKERNCEQTSREDLVTTGTIMPSCEEWPYDISVAPSLQICLLCAIRSETQDWETHKKPWNLTFGRDLEGDSQRKSTATAACITRDLGIDLCHHKYLHYLHSSRCHLKS
jgi:hypothetical protein